MSPVTFQPLTNHLVLEVEPEPELSSLIRVQRDTEGLARFGKVIAIGPEVRDVKVGMRILASLTAGVQVGDGYQLIAEPAVQGVIHQ